MASSHSTFTMESSEYTSRLARTLFGGAESASLETKLARGAIGSFGLKISFTGFAFLVSLILARTLGAAQYGVYAYILAWVNVLCIGVLAGLENVIIREVATGQARSAWGVVRGLLRWSNRVVLALAVTIGLVAALAATGIARQVNWPHLPAFLIALILLPLMSLTRIRQSAMQGLQNVIAGQFPEAVIQPTIFIGLIAASHFVWRWTLSARSAFALYAIAAAVALVFGAAVLQFNLPPAAKQATPEYKPRQWIKGALPLLLVSGVSVLNAQVAIVLLGAIKGSQTVGVYAITGRISDLIQFGLISVNLALAPVAARLWAQRDLPRLQLVVTKSIRAALIFTLAAGTILVVFGERLLSVFGPEFPAGQPALVLLVIGQTVNVAMGPVALLLVMTGHERVLAISTCACGVLNIVLNVVLVPFWGLVGTAMSLAISLSVWNILLAVWIKRRLGIHPTAIGVIGGQTQR